MQRSSTQLTACKPLSAHFPFMLKQSTFEQLEKVCEEQTVFQRQDQQMIGVVGK